MMLLCFSGTKMNNKYKWAQTWYYVSIYIYFFLFFILCKRYKQERQWNSFLQYPISKIILQPIIELLNFILLHYACIILVQWALHICNHPLAFELNYTLVFIFLSSYIFLPPTYDIDICHFSFEWWCAIINLFDPLWLGYTAKVCLYSPPSHNTMKCIYIQFLFANCELHTFAWSSIARLPCTSVSINHIEAGYLNKSIEQEQLNMEKDLR